MSLAWLGQRFQGTFFTDLCLKTDNRQESEQKIKDKKEKVSLVAG